MKKIIHNPHDKFFKQSMADPRVAKAFFEYHLPAFIKQEIDFNSLQLRQDSYIDTHLKLALTDVVFSVNFNQQPGYLYTLVEHQTKPDKLMPFRLLKYMMVIMEQHLKTTQTSQLPIVYPLLFYTGQATYPHSTDLFDLFQDAANLAKQIFMQPFQLIDINRIPDTVLKQNVWLGVMELCMKHIFARDILPYFQNMLNLLQQVEQAGGSDYIQTALTYLLTVGEVNDSKQFLETIQTHLSPETGTKIMTIAQQIEARGIKKGETEAKKAIAQKLLEQGLSTEAISQITELTADQIHALNNPSSH